MSKSHWMYCEKRDKEATLKHMLLTNTVEYIDKHLTMVSKCFWIPPRPTTSSLGYF